MCSSLAFPTQAQVPAINADGVQDAVMAVSADGRSVLNQRRNCANAFSAMIIDTNGLTSITIDLSANPALAQIRLGDEGAVSMTGDALTVVGLNPTRTGFLTSSRPARESSAFAAAVPGVFANIGFVPPATVQFPVISADGLAFYYTVRNSPNADLNGHYETVRSSASELFPPGIRMGGDLTTSVEYITGVSSDRMTLFVSTSFVGSMLTRRSVRQPFTNPNAPAPAPIVAGWRIRPLADCTKLLATCTGGCNNEQTCVFSR